MENFLENLEEKLPKSIKVKHSLGNLFKKMNLELSEKKKTKENIIQINEMVNNQQLIGRSLENNLNKKKHEKKIKNKLEAF